MAPVSLTAPGPDGVSVGSVVEPSTSSSDPGDGAGAATKSDIHAEKCHDFRCGRKALGRLLEIEVVQVHWLDHRQVDRRLLALVGGEEEVPQSDDSKNGTRESSSGENETPNLLPAGLRFQRGSSIHCG